MLGPGSLPRPVRYDCSMANTAQTSTFARFMARTLASGIGSGYLRPAPGTWGSAAALALLVAWQPAPAVLSGAFCFSVPVAYWAIAQVQSGADAQSDPGWIVVDEWQGLALGWLLATPASPIGYTLLFCLFRLFDARKLGPIRAADASLEGPWGVMVDDWLAGIAAGLVTRMVLVLVAHGI